MATLRPHGRHRVSELGMCLQSPAICLKEAIAAALETTFDSPITPKDIFPDHLHPHKAGAVKEFEKLLKQLHRENFELKLELFFRDQDRESGGGGATGTIEFIQLQVKAENLSKELDYKNQLLRETLKTLQQLESKYGTEVELCQSYFVPDFHTPFKPSMHHVSHLSRLNEMSSDDSGNGFDSNATPQLETELGFLLQLVALDDKQDSASLKDALSDVLQKLDEPLRKKFLHFLRVLHRLKFDLKESDKKIKTLEMGDVAELPHDLDSVDSSTSSYIKENEVKLMEQELNSLHQAIREKEMLIKELLDKQAAILEESKASTEHYITVINNKDAEKNQLEIALDDQSRDLVRKDVEIQTLLQKLEQLQQKAMERSFDSQLFSDELLTHSQLYLLDGEKEELSRKVQELESAALTKEIEITESKLMLSTKDAELEVVHKDLKDAQNELVQLRAASAEKQNGVELLRKKLEDALEQNRILKGDLAAREEELFGASAQMRHLSEVLESERSARSVRPLLAHESGDSGSSISRNNVTTRRGSRESTGDTALRKKYKESVDRILVVEGQLELMTERMALLEHNSGTQFKEGEKGEKRLSSSMVVVTVPETVERSSGKKDLMLLDDRSESVISSSSSFHQRSQFRDFSKFGQSNDLLELKEQILLLVLHINQLEYDSKERNASLEQQLEESRDVCKLLHSHLEELADFLESLLQCEDISRLIRSSLTTDSLARMESLLSHGLDHSLNLSRSIWMADATVNSKLTLVDHLDLEPSRDRDLSIITVTSHLKENVAGEELESDFHDKNEAHTISGRRLSKAGKLRLDRLDEMVQKGDKICIELSRMNIQSNHLIKRLLNKLESDGTLTEEVDSQLKGLRKRIEEMIAHCAKLMETFKKERHRKQLDETLEKVDEVHGRENVSVEEVSPLKRASSYGDVRNARNGLEASRNDLQICLQELISVQQKLGSSFVQSHDSSSNETVKDSLIGARLLNAARQTVSVLLQQVLDRDSAVRSKEAELSQYHRDLELCLEDLRHIQRKVSSQETVGSEDCLDRFRDNRPSEMPKLLHHATRKIVKNLLQQILEKESELKLGRERISELERAFEGKKREVRQIQDWNLQLHKEKCQRDGETSKEWDDSVQDQLRDAREKLDSALRELEEKNREAQRDIKELDAKRNDAEKKLEQEKLELCNVLVQMKVLEEELESVKVQNKGELKRRQESSEFAVEKLKENNNQLKGELQQTKQHYDALRSQVLSLKSELECVSQADADILERDATIRSLESKCIEMKNKMDDMEEREYQAMSQIKEKNRQISALEDAIARSKREIENLLTEQKQLCLKEEQMRVCLEDRERTVSSLQGDVSRLSREVEKSQSDLSEKDRLNRSLQVSITEHRQRLESLTADRLDEKHRYDQVMNEKNRSISDFERVVCKLREQVESLAEEKRELERECEQQRVLLENRVSQDARKDSLHSTNCDLRQDVEVHKQMLKQMEEWNVGIQQQIQQRERLWADEKDRMKQENSQLKKRIKKVLLRKGQADMSSIEPSTEMQRLQDELKEASQVNASLQLELKVYQHLSHKASSEDSHQTDVLLDLVQEMRQLRGELIRSVRANTKLQHRLERYVQQDSKGTKPDLVVVSSSASSSTDNIPKLTYSRSTDHQQPSRFSSDSSLHMRVRELLGEEAHLRPVSTAGFSSSNEDLRSVYSSPDLGIESDPNRDSSSTTSSHIASAAVVIGGSSRISTAAPRTTFSTPVFGDGLGPESTIYAVGNLQAFELLQKQISECLVVLKGMKARLHDQVHNFSNASSPSKNVEHNTLKELDRSCYFLQVYLDKSQMLLTSFRPHPQISPLLEENSILREEVATLRNQVREQNVQLQKAQDKLAISKNKKDGMERAITKQLSKTRKVLKQAKCNLLEENMKQTSQQT